MKGERPTAEIDEVVAEVRLSAGGQANGRGDALSRAATEAKSFASRYGRYLAGARDRHAISIEAVESYERWRTAVATLLLSGVSD